VSAGVGYWVITSKDVTVSASGMEVPPTDFVVGPLPSGWNIIGQPFKDNGVIWGEARVKVGETEYNLSDQSWVEQSAYGFESGYFTVDPSGILQPWNGYWVKVNESAEDVYLILPPADTNASSAKVGLKAASSADPALQQGIRMTLHEEGKPYVDRTVFLGLNPDASAGPDRKDCLAPPQISDEVPRLFVDHRTWKSRPGEYAVDVRPLKKAPVSFNLTLKAPKRTVATTYVLNWKTLGSIAPDRTITLVDKRKPKSINMRAKDGYRIVVPKGATKYKVSVLVR
jgi:hypothetical protein